MTDIVERLRREAFRGPTMDAAHLRDIRWIAADEIERLRRELEIERNTVRILTAQADGDTATITDEIERLRDALTEAIDFAEQDFHALTPAGEAMATRWREALEPKP